MKCRCSGVSITTCVTSVRHDFEKLNLYVVLMLLSIPGEVRDFICLTCSKKRAKIKLVAIICMTTSIGGGGGNLFQTRDRTAISVSQT